MKYSTKIILFVIILPCTLFANDIGQDKVAEVLGTPIFRNQITDNTGHILQSKLHELVIRPVLKKYMEEKKIDFEPSPDEIRQFVGYYLTKHEEEIKNKKEGMVKEIEHIKDRLDEKGINSEERENLELDLTIKQMDLEGPGKDFAMFVLPHRKMQIHFYNNFGGGRILWQQRGIEAFDAMHAWLKTQEKNGRFVIVDNKTRDAFYHYWTTMNHGSFLIEDKQRIHNEFLKPEWMSHCDSGGEDGVTDRACDFYRNLRRSGQARRFMLIKGSGSRTAARIQETYPDNRTRKGRQAGARGDVPVWQINTNLIKDAVSNNMARTEPGPGYMHWPDWLKPWFFDELTAENRQDNGTWDKIGLRNEAFDLYLYGYAGVLRLGADRMDWQRPRPWACTWDENPEIITGEEHDPAPLPVRPAGRRTRFRMS